MSRDDAIRLDMLDCPTAWAIQRRGGLDHDPQCSSLPDAVPGMSGPHFLCDCKAVEREWERLVAASSPASGGEA